MNQHPQRPARNRVLEMLAILQMGLCGRCGRARYATRRTARHAARIAAPATRLRAYRCGDTWHLTVPAGRPQFIAPPVTTVQETGRGMGGLDQRRRGERRYGRFAPAGPTRPRSRRRPPWSRSGSDPLEDARDTRPTDTRPWGPRGPRGAAPLAGGAR